jgi:hypothetical protein
MSLLRGTGAGTAPVPLKVESPSLVPQIVGKLGRSGEGGWGWGNEPSLIGTHIAYNPDIAPP